MISYLFRSWNRPIFDGSGSGSGSKRMLHRLQLQAKCAVSGSSGIPAAPVSSLTSTALSAEYSNRTWFKWHQNTDGLIDLRCVREGLIVIMCSFRSKAKQCSKWDDSSHKHTLQTFDVRWTIIGWRHIVIVMPDCPYLLNTVFFRMTILSTKLTLARSGGWCNPPWVFLSWTPHRLEDRAEILHSLWGILCGTFGEKNWSGQVRSRSYDVIRGTTFARFQRNRE